MSIIIPVYNSINYLSTAVDSVLSQSLEEIELILVNDKSTDGSGYLCDKYSLKDKRVKVIHNAENLGISKTRNIGIQNASGKYIGFCDDDDYFKDNLILDNYYLAEEVNADIVKFGRLLIDINENNEITNTVENNIKKKLVYNKSEMMDNFFLIRNQGKFVNVWDGLYKREMILKNNIKFDESMKFGSEDSKFTLECFFNAETFVLNNRNYYVHYRRDLSSTSRKFNYNKIESLINTCLFEKKIWSILPSTRKTKLNIFKSINAYIVTIYTSQILHKDSDFLLEDKIAFFDEIRKHDHMNYQLSFKFFIYFLFKDIKHAVFSLLYSKKRNRLLYRLIKLTNKIIRR